MSSNAKSFYISVYKDAVDKLSSSTSSRGAKPSSGKEEQVLKKALEDLRGEVMQRATSPSMIQKFREKVRDAEEVLDEIEKGYESLGYRVINLKFTTKKNFIVGTRQGPLFFVYEVGISWDPILDLPYIPASSLKGALRSYMIDLCINKAENKKRCIEDVISLFGVPVRDDEIPKLAGSNSNVVSEEGSEGLLIVSDAYPISFAETLLTPDIINPHYYTGGVVVKNEFEVQPVPITFLSVSSNVTFRVIVAVSSEGEKYVSELSQTFFKSDNYSMVPFITFAFAMGIGAKTSRGYGEFDLADFGIKSVNESKKGRKAARITWGEKK